MVCVQGGILVTCSARDARDLKMAKQVRPHIHNVPLIHMKSIYEFQRKRSIELGETKLGVQVTSTADCTVYALYAHCALHSARAPTWMI
jgi:hypothetical protein